MQEAFRRDEALRIGVQERGLFVLLPMLIAMATGTHSLAKLAGGGLVDPDSYMRLVRLEDAMRQHDLAYVVARDGSGAGTLLHWSHLLDSLLYLLALPLQLLMDPDTALHAAAVVWGPLCMGGLGLALGWAVAPLADARWRWMAPVAAALSTPIVIYGLPGVAHHHVPLLVVAVMTTGYALRGGLRIASPSAGLAMGTWAAVGIWLSPESMPFTLMAFGGLWLAWLTQQDGRLLPMFMQAASSFGAVVAAAWVVDPPYAGYAAAEIDRLSVIYLALAGAFIAMALLARLLAGTHGRRRIACGLAIPLLCLGTWLALFPALLRGPDGLMNAAQTHAMLGAISEMLPVRTIGEAVEMLLTGTVAAGVLWWWTAKDRSPLLLYAALCATGLVALGAGHVRFASYPATAGAAMLPILVTRCSARFSAWPETGQASLRLGLIALFALAPRIDCLPALFTPASAATGQATASCDLSNAAALLADHAGQVLMADPTSAPELLYRTQVLTVGSLYHRNVEAFMRLRAAWRSPASDTVPGAVRATGASLLLFCRSPTRSLLVADLPPDTLMDRMNQGRIPAWLHRLAEDSRSGNVLYEVAP